MEAKDKIELPVREEFGFKRTTCDCRECTINCEYVPGYLVPADLNRIQAYVGGPKKIVAWARTRLLASPGAIVRRVGGEPFRIPTIVPARQLNGHCIWLENSRCSIHPVSPFGCAFADSHMSDEEGMKVSGAGLRDILRDFNRAGPYSSLWKTLAHLGLHAPDLVHAREAMRIAWAAEKNGGQ